MGKARGRPANPPETSRSRLLTAAARLFNTDGYFGTDSNKIARAAGFAPATFYRHFKDKKQIFLEAYSHWVASDWEVIEAESRSDAPPADVARAICAAHLARHRDWVTLRRSMHALVATDPEARAFHMAVRGEQLTRLESLLARLGAPRRPRGDLLYSFLCIERAANAVTDDDLDALGTAAGDVIARIEAEIVTLLTGRYSPPALTD